MKKNKNNADLFQQNPITYCQCRKCNSVFDYKEREKKPISFGMTREVCPKCGGSFTVIKWKDGLHGADEYILKNPNFDSRLFA